MMDLEGFKAMVDDIVAQGYDRETAAEYAYLIGDTPELDENDKWLVVDGGEILARLEPLDKEN